MDNVIKNLLLKRPQNDLRKKQQDGVFCYNTVLMLKELAVALGPDAASWISQDYKSRVPIGLPAANKQDVVLMHLEYRVRLPDHDWVVASRRKLIPSGYVYCKIEDDKVSYIVDPHILPYGQVNIVKALRPVIVQTSTNYWTLMDFKRT